MSAEADLTYATFKAKIPKDQLLMAARNALAVLKRQIDSNCCGKDEHEAIKLLTESLHNCAPRHYRWE